jgi:multidrug efflux pump subunit AcrA (membrane-fusion protein)
MHLLFQRSSKALLTVLIGISTLHLAACGFGNKEGNENGQSSLGSENNPFTITTAVAEVREVPLYKEATGSFVAEESSDVAPLTSGRVLETPVDVGARVERGDIIARLDDADAVLRLEQARASAEQAEAALRQAQAKIGFAGGIFNPEEVPEVQSAQASYKSALADAKMAEADAERYANLVETGDISRSAYEKQATQAETARARADTALKQYETALNTARQNYQAIASAQAFLAAAKAQLAQAQKAVDDTVIKAPISGYVTERPIAVGEYVTPASRILTIVQSNPIKLQMQIAGPDSTRIGVGMKVMARVEGLGDREFEGKITVLNPSLDPDSRSMMVEAKFENPSMELRPGMFATARVLLPGKEQAVMVPRNAVLVDSVLDSAEVFIIQEGKARVSVVNLGKAEADNVRILSGVSAGDVVATNRLPELYDGASVTME